MAEFRDTVFALVRDNAGWTLREMAVLMALRERPDAGERQMVALVRDFGIPAPAVSRVANTLVEAGLVRRGGLDGDARASVLTLTAAGAQTADALARGWE